MARVFLGCPIYGNRLVDGAARGLYGGSSRQHHVEIKASSASLLTLNCNSLWVTALNGREKRGVEWFAMLHSDVEPEPAWLDTLIAEADRVGADLLSAVIPLKDASGVTSTAIAHPSVDTSVFCR